MERFEPAINFLGAFVKLILNFAAFFVWIGNLKK